MPNPLFPGMENFPRPPGDIHQALTMYQVGGIFFVIVFNLIIIIMMLLVIIIIIIIIATGGAKPAPAECNEGARREKCAHSKQVLYMMMTMMREMVVVMLVMVMVLTPSRCC